ncbi:MAG: 4-(cytidine 5'-diphospho)-2-C-methyl-D-erythritol kinase [Deltaproteobacteria bacterium]
MAEIRIAAPAKVNLVLRVLGKRKDGYHDILTLLQKVDLRDDITVTATSGDPDVRLTCTGIPCPVGTENLAHRAASFFLEESGVRLSICIDLHKRIPIGAGLGGGSSDAAAVLKGLNLLAGSPLTTDRLYDIAARLGSDVPFFLLDQGAAYGRGRGTELTPVAGRPLWYLLVYPGFGLSTAQVYADFSLTTEKGETILERSGLDTEDLGINDLEKAVFPRHPLLARLADGLRLLGAQHALMSGSGSTVYGIFPGRIEAYKAKRSIQSRWVRKERHPGFTTFVAEGIE